MDILSNKSYKQYSRLSRYSQFPYYYNKLDRKYTYGTTANLYKNTTYSLYTVKLRDTLDSIALDYYNNPTYFWIIADFNRIQDPFEDLEVGLILKIPTISTIEFNYEVR